MDLTDLTDLTDFANYLYKNKCFKIGEFILKSGIKSPYYLDLRGAICNPKLLINIVNYFNKFTYTHKNNYIVCGIPYSGIPLATLYSNYKNNPMIIIRKERKEYGTGKLIEGIYKKDDKVILMEDVISTGKSILEVIEQLELEGLIIKNICIVVDREMGGVEMLKKKGYDVKIMIKISDLLLKMYTLKHIDCIELSMCLQFSKYFEKINNSVLFHEKNIKSEIGQNLIKLMLKKNSNLCLSADVNSCDDLLNVAEKCGPYIVILKTHIDTLEEVNNDILKKLRLLADKYEFLIFEDRKLCDIGNTVKKQANLISNWADIVNMHSLAGEKSVESIDADIGLLLVGELSCKGNLIDYEYIIQTVEIAKKHSDKVFGFISQKAIGGTEFLHLTPGIKFSSGEDGMGQIYKTPQQAIKDGADLIIVGRGILEADDIEKECEKYKNAGWEEYVKKLL